ncbi:hypothetical protein TWF694_002867 [Orbilia ellipsospora]|uniref:C2H2-type domain-containing protein n=1 Tax=Orbilia ellipsospora TaxID=2528407 RepID=A0AAV9X165_9PEZI
MLFRNEKKSKNVNKRRPVSCQDPFLLPGGSRDYGYTVLKVQPLPQQQHQQQQNKSSVSISKRISRRLSLAQGTMRSFPTTWWKSSSSSSPSPASKADGSTSPSNNTTKPDSNPYIISDIDTPTSRIGSPLYLQQNSQLWGASKRHSIAVTPTSSSLRMAASRRRESTMGDFLMMIDPTESTTDITSPDPHLHLHDESIDSFLREFSNDPSQQYSSLSGFTTPPPETQGLRPESPQGRTRSRPLTPTLNDEFDIRSLNITPEPVLGQPSTGFDSPPPYNSWSTELPQEKDEKFLISEGEEKLLVPGTAAAEVQTTVTTERGLLPWYNDVSGNRASFHSLDEIQPPSYPSLAVEAPERHTWAGDGKDENIWKRFANFVENPTDEEAGELLRKAEMETLAGSAKKRLLNILGGSSKKTERSRSRSRSRSPTFASRRSDEDLSNTVTPPSPTFGRARRNTGAWWLGGSRNNSRESLQDTADGEFSRETRSQELPLTSGSSISLAESLPPLTEEHADMEKARRHVDALIEQMSPGIPPIFDSLGHDSNSVLPQVPEESEDIDIDFDFLPPTAKPTTNENEPPIGVCGICGENLLYHQGGATENWYMTMKNHFQVAHGSWAARMPTWFGTTPEPTDDKVISEPVEMDLDVPEFHLKPSSASDVGKLVPKLPEAIEESKDEEPKAHECPVPNCTEAFAAFQELNVHIFERHGIRGSPLGLTKPTVASLEKQERGRNNWSGYECPSFSCNSRFETYEDRDKHMEALHGIKPRPSHVDTPLLDKMAIDLWNDDEDFKGAEEDDLSELSPLNLKKPSTSNISSTTMPPQDLQTSEFKQLWQGFTNSIKLHNDISPEASNPNQSLTVYSTSSAAGPAHHHSLGMEDGPKEAKLLSRTLSELLRVVIKTSSTDSLTSKENFDVQGWLRDYLTRIEPEAAETIIASGPTYYENISVAPNEVEWVQRIKNELDQMKPGRSRKGKERATEYLPDPPANISGPNPAKVNTSFLDIRGVRDPQAEETSRVKLASMNDRFLTAANNAYDKLLAGTKRPNASNEFKEFVASLGGVQDIVDVGTTVLDQILAEEVPRSLKKVYCFLHVAYAISQSESSSEKATALEFQAGLSVFRFCLPAVSEIPGMPSERDIFDEIANVMWEELEYALKWIETWDGNEALNKVGYAASEVEGLKDFMRSHCDCDGTEQKGMAASMTIDPKLLCLGAASDSQMPVVEQSSKPEPSFEDLLGCGIFAIVARWLKELKETGVIFAYICGGLCSTLASSFKKRVKFKDRTIHPSASQLASHLQQDVVSHLNSYKYTGVENVTSIALSMINQGYISTIREFENYVIDLARVARRTQEEFCAFVYAVVWHCNSCATFVPDNLWGSCRGVGEVDYSLQYVDEQVNKEITWFTGKPTEERETVTVGHVSIPENADVTVEQLRDFTMGEDVRPLNVNMCAIDTLLLPPTPTKQENSPFSTASSSSPNNYDSLWENSPRGHQGSETSFSNPNSNNVTPDEIYVNPNMPNANNFATDYFSYSRPQMPAPAPVVVEPIAGPSRESQPKASRKRKYLEGDGATSFPARRRKMVQTTGRRLYCDVPGCEEFASTSSNLSRHKRTKHGNKAVREASYHCGEAGCDRVFYGPRGKGNLRTHMRKDHGV